jgi:hypothetical protein
MTWAAFVLCIIRRGGGFNFAWCEFLRLVTMSMMILVFQMFSVP